MNEIWVVEMGNRYEGAYETNYFMKYKSALDFARENYGRHLQWKTNGPDRLYAEYQRQDYVAISKEEVTP